MIINNSNLDNKLYDVIIIGSGPAGITLANKLEEKKIKIALLEAGGEDYSNESQDYYKGEIEGEFPRKTNISRLRMFGGTTGHWGGSSRPLDSYDFKFWPIEKSNLDSYLEEAAKIIEVKNQFREMEFPNSKNLKIIEFQVSNVRFGNKYLKQIKRSNFIDLFLNTNLTKIEGEEFSFKKVICLFNNKKIQISGKYLVLATGGIENSRILLLNEQNSKNLFASNMPIGKFWYEHPFAKLGKAIINEKKINSYLRTNYNHFVNMFDTGDASITYNISPTEKFINENKILNSCIWLVLHKRTNKGWKNLLEDLLCIAPNLSNNLLKLINREVACGSTLYSSWEQEGEEKNKIVLSKSIKDINGYPAPKIIYTKSNLVKKTAKLCLEEIGKYLAENDIGRIRANSFLFDDNEEFMSGAGWHHMGGTIMGEDPKKSVVDKNLKLFGSKNIYITGSSVFPSGGHANPTITIIQLSLRLANHLAKLIV